MRRFFTGKFCRAPLAWLVAALGAFSGSSLAANYLEEVKPIFAQHCYTCHGASQQKGGMRMDTAAFARKGGDTGPGLVPGNAAESLIVQALRGTHPEISQMPYKKAALPEEAIRAVEGWINAGAAAPEDEDPENGRHWAFVPPQRVEAPALKDGSRARNAIDQFIQARLEREGIGPAPEADRATLLRRLALDLTGLPPKPAELDEFLNDASGDVYDRAVERLLASAHYGERWGRWWLDVARYGDSNGYSIDAPRQIWKYRDWVIAAINQDMPFDQFAVEQLAGDLLPGASIEQRIATGFNRNTQVNQEGGIDPEQFRVESVMDRVNTYGTAFLGLTVACAQCHDHKFDPVSQREYYQLYAFFNNAEEDGHGKGAPSGMLAIPGEFEDQTGLLKELEEARAELDRFLNTKGSVVDKWEGELGAEAVAKLSKVAREGLAKVWSERSLDEKRAAYAAFKAEDPEFKSRDAKLVRLEKREPKPVTTLVMKELPKPRETRLFTKGDFTRPAEVVQPGVLGILHKPDGALLNRLDLARWTVAPANPLFARVVVNRLWQQYFGRGLVETENDFGTQGIPPTHPELLDWLALELMQPSSAEAQPWSLKHLHRLITRSATYRQSSRVRPELAVIDPNNKLLARQSRLRLDAEIVRDVALSASGLLEPQLGGAPVYPPQPDGVMALGQVRRAWTASTGAQRYRRAIYTHLWRATPHPALAVFDAPDGFSSCTRRLRSNTPLQALTLLNDQQFFEMAEALGQQLEALPGDERAKLREAFRLCLGREPKSMEADRLLALLRSEDERPWLSVARVLLNLDETITRE